MAEIPRSAATLGVVSTRWPPGLRMRFTSPIRCMGSSNRCSISSQQSTVEKDVVGVRKAVSFGIEVVDVAVESFAIGGGDLAMVGAAQFAVVAAANIAIAQLAAERGRDLQVRAHFQNAVARAARRSHFERLHEAGLMRIQILARFVATRPAAQVIEGVRARRLRYGRAAPAWRRGRRSKSSDRAGFEEPERYCRATAAQLHSRAT